MGWEARHINGAQKREGRVISMREWNVRVKEAGGWPAVHQANPQTAVHFSKPPCAPPTSVNSLSNSLLPTPLLLHPHPPSKPYRFCHSAPASLLWSCANIRTGDTAGSTVQLSPSALNINKNDNQQNYVDIDDQNKYSHPPIFTQKINIYCSLVHVCYSKSNQ